jgi:NAD(P)-dependent dehydrogenase (short-subunit alcohol dehydrogenase family)
MPYNNNLPFLEQLFSLSGRTAIVTGASKGIGWALADGLARAGANVFGLARSINPIHQQHQNVQYHSCDITETGSFDCIRDLLLEQHGRLDILINAAGISLQNQSLDSFDKTLETNLRGPFLCIQSASTVMRSVGRGSIINITSLGAFRGFPNNPTYIAAKGGLSAMTRAFAYDLGPMGIRVNNLVPGYIKTEMTINSFNDSMAYEQRLKHTMLGRWGNTEDLIGAAVFLSSDASGYITGQDLVVDGGWLAKGLT